MRSGVAVRAVKRAALISVAVLAALPASAAMVAPAGASGMSSEGVLPRPFALPFAGMLLSIALGPLVVKEWWHIHYEKAAAFWAGLTLIGLCVTAGPSAAARDFVHCMAAEYLPFILMLFAFYTAAGGVVVEGKLKGTPLVNTSVLAVGTLAASIIGTTAASMILIRPLLRANSARKHTAHVVVFLIFLVSNIGGVLTPLGNPPLFLGYLHGVDFFWPARNLWPQTLLAAGVLLALFFLLDTYFYRREERPPPGRPVAPKLKITGLANVALIGFAVSAIAASGFWRPGIALEVLGTRIELQNLVRELAMIFVGCASLLVTKPGLRAATGFDWEPIREVAILFAGIFICIIPVMAMLHAGTSGPFAPVIGLLARADGTPNNAAYFWTTGVLSSFLDNAPTYLVFFELAGGDPLILTGPLAKTLAAISLGAVFMGANTYIGNAPNFMVYAIARRARANAPGFFAYMLWSAGILLPLFAAITFLFLT
jgi:Na+/H+ antiporter NhaD/arsenite permease-like protein